ncbi:hypothetical protein QVA72_12480 [Staphylococcus simulans]|uniref:Uncharacterized protein n=1 Tax=Staphylococcus simulans UMC-CNS-990 TaxID=1405498 RepID=A0ABN0PAB0_STASI|nr:MULTISPECIES: hypothetical protein [Staphylococcus]ERS92453.1 hypothetical protein SSIM_12000 [Staphylococcus simulans UMC-CNS-990]EZR66277.1 hypothetical protein W787_02577 [Staphylococcus aureus VET1422S]KAG50013.1 hypothetical protein W771_02505 [Staphylococcus aureus VET1035S]KAG53750.1 hypothetical protein W772_02486 [Staphylococcus aureus VET1048S]MCE5150106.1 hypothetical protein [Staphylococcus simulans]
MDTKYNAIEMINKLNIELLDDETHDISNGEEMIPNNPLVMAVYEILYQEIVEPVFDMIEKRIGKSDVNFVGFVKSDYDDSVELIFANPAMHIESHIGNEVIEEKVATLYIEENAQYQAIQKELQAYNA